MAEELRWEQLVVSVADGTILENAGATFRNTTDERLHIRKIFIRSRLSNGAADENAITILSKQRTIVAGNNEPGFNLITDLIMPNNTTTTPDDGGVSVNRTVQFAKGELNLEPNEALFVNTTKTTGGNLDATYLLGYHF